MSTHDDTPGCHCDETWIIITDRDGKLTEPHRILPPLEHICYYVTLRNALIPRAEREAWKRGRDERNTSAYNISKHFSITMDTLVARAWRMVSAGGHTEPGPERNRAFFAAMIELAGER